jgi:hypothetical protein
LKIFLLQVMSGKVAILEMPSDVTVAILSNCVDMKGLAKLDTALCSSVGRPHFLALIRHQSFVADTMYTGSMMTAEKYFEHFTWMVERRMRVRNWTLSENVAKFCSPLFIKCIAGPHVRSIHFLLTTEEVTGACFALAAVPAELQILKIEDCRGWAGSKLSVTAQKSLQKPVLAYSDGTRWTSYAQYPNLRKLYVIDLRGKAVKQTLSTLFNAAPNLIDLRLWAYTQCPINDESLRLLSNHASGLENLELRILPQEFSSTAVVSLAERCGNLITLNLTCGNGVNDAAVEAFALHCSRLEGLQMTGTLNLPPLAAVAMRCGSRLRYLCLDMYHFATDTLVVMAEHCRHLEELQLHYCRLRARGALIQMISSLPNLRELMILQSRVLTDVVLIAIATHQSALQHLGLIGCSGGYTEAGAHALVTSLTQLQRFCIYGSDGSVFTSVLFNSWHEASPSYRYALTIRRQRGTLNGCAGS